MAIATDASREIMMCQFAWRYTLTDRSRRDFKSSNTPEISWCFWTHCTIHRQGVASKDFEPNIVDQGRSQWPRSLRRISAASRFLGLWVRFLLGTWISLFECYVLSSIGLCVRLLVGQVSSAVTHLTFLVLDSARA